MKHIVQTGAQALIAYFVVLPMLFALHANQHQHHGEANETDEWEYVHLTPDCSLCDLYYSQVAVVETSSNSQAKQTIVVFQLGLYESLGSATIKISHLRGPPVA